MHQESKWNPNVERTSHKSRQAFLHNPALEQNFQFWQAGLRILQKSIDIRNPRDKSD